MGYRDQVEADFSLKARTHLNAKLESRSTLRLRQIPSGGRDLPLELRPVLTLPVSLQQVRRELLPELCRFFASVPPRI